MPEIDLKALDLSDYKVVLRTKYLILLKVYVLLLAVMIATHLLLNLYNHFSIKDLNELLANPMKCSTKCPTPISKYFQAL